MREYKGIKVDDSCRLFKRDGSYNKATIRSLEVFKNLLEENQHTLLSAYVKDKKKVLIDFNCGHEPNWLTPNDYKSGASCPRCANNNPQQAEKDLLSHIKENNHDLLSEYVNCSTKVLIDYKCGHEPHWILPYCYKQGQSCPRCSGRSSEQAKEDFFTSLSRKGYVALSDYIDNRHKVLVDFNCGHEPQWIIPNIYKLGHECKHCGNKMKNQTRSEESKEDFVRLIEQNGHKLLGEYTKCKEKVLIDFNCGHKPHEMNPNSYKNGQRCPSCSESKGEKAIREWLERNGIVFETQFIFPCDEKRRRYDFFLPYENLIVEVHGLQHYEESSFFHSFHENEKGRKSFKEEKKNDIYKEKLALSLGCSYMVVDYREHNPQLTLERFIEQFNKRK